MKQNDWKIIYTSYSGTAKRAVNLLSKELSTMLIREEGMYRIHVLPCEKEGCEISKNAFFLGLYDESKVISKYVSRDEIPEGGFLVKVTKNPEYEEGQIVILTANSEETLFYAAVSFLDDYIPEYAPKGGSNPMPELIFDRPLPECSYTQTPDHKRRSIFTWGHSINDYRAYIDNMARLKLNELVLWNDYIPLNISDIIDYAHSYGIKVILGYSWGWNEIEDNLTDEDILRIKTQAIKEYRECYAPVHCDGIYFQSFTERKEETISGKLVAAVITDMVNEIASALWEITPDLRLIFGLHATSVNKRLSEIARVDPRVEILWEDCGEFPFNYNTDVTSEEKYEETKDLIKKILHLRGGVGVGLVFKGVMMLDWTKFIHQRGPYVMGENSSLVAIHDRKVRAGAWRVFSSEWMRSGDRVLEMQRFINENKIGEVNMCTAGTFDGGIYLPFAISAQMFWNSKEDYRQMLRRTARRSCITVD